VDLWLQFFFGDPNAADAILWRKPKHLKPQMPTDNRHNGATATGLDFLHTI
jgi:hypothetical protein